MKSNSTTFFRYFHASARDRELGLHVSTAGESHIAPGAKYPLFGHPEGYLFDWKHGRRLGEFAIVYISGGSGSFESRPGGRRQIQAGHVFLLFPGIWHRYRPDKATGWHEHWVGFAGEWAKKWMQGGFVSPMQPVAKATHEAKFRELFAEAMAAIKAGAPALQQVLAGVTAHLLGLLVSAEQAGHPEGYLPKDLVQKVIEYLRANLAAPANMQALAREFAVSASRLRHTFTAHTGMSPLHYLLNLRLAHAQSLLAETALPLKTVAESAGFADQAYFWRFFHKQTGQTPGQWRRRTQPRPPR